MCESQNKEFGMYYNQKNTCVKVEKTEFSMYSGSKKQVSGSFTTETCFEFDLAWLVAMLTLSFWIFSRNQ